MCLKARRQDSQRLSFKVIVDERCQGRSFEDIEGEVDAKGEGGRERREVEDPTRLPGGQGDPAVDHGCRNTDA